MVAVQQQSLGPAPAIGIPMHGHHIGEVHCRRADVPCFPIDNPNVLAVCLVGQEAVPPVRIAVSDRQVAAREGPREQTGRPLDQSFV